MDPHMARPPGVMPLKGPWLIIDDAFDQQMAERDRLIASVPERVHALQTRARPAADELYQLVLEQLGQTSGYLVAPDHVVRPDGIRVQLDPANPLLVLGRLVQEDLCLMEKIDDEHVLTGAILCFPASWTLFEKLGRPLVGIHQPVADYTQDLAKRVQRLFNSIRPEQGLWRMNAFVYFDPTLHQPKPEHAPRTDRSGGDFVRSERQTMLRLPKTDAVLFAIHTYVVAADSIDPETRATLDGPRHPS
jgi:hypothetical protein